MVKMTVILIQHDYHNNHTSWLASSSSLSTFSTWLSSKYIISYPLFDSSTAPCTNNISPIITINSPSSIYLMIIKKIMIMMNGIMMIARSDDDIDDDDNDCDQG